MEVPRPGTESEMQLWPIYHSVAMLNPLTTELAGIEPEPPECTATEVRFFFFMTFIFSIIVDLQCSVNFYCTEKWPSHTYTYIFFFPQIFSSLSLFFLFFFFFLWCPPHFLSHWENSKNQGRNPLPFLTCFFILSRTPLCCFFSSLMAAHIHSPVGNFSSSQPLVCQFGLLWQRSRDWAAEAINIYFS